METFNDFILQIENPEHKRRVEEILNWITVEYPQMEQRIAWNQPMFTDHGTFIFSLSTAKKHIALSPEFAGIEHFSKDIIIAGYEHSKMLFKIKWSDSVDFNLLRRIIDYNIEEKKDCDTFWRKDS